MRSQENGELMKHRQTEQNKDDVEEDEDEEYGVRKTVKPSKEEREKVRKERPTCRFAVGADTA